MNFLTAKSLKKSASANLLFTSGARSRSSWHAWTNWSQRTASDDGLFTHPLFSFVFGRLILHFLSPFDGSSRKGLR